VKQVVKHIAATEQKHAPFFPSISHTAQMLMYCEAQMVIKPPYPLPGPARMAGVNLRHTLHQTTHCSALLHIVREENQGCD
jgi:hypothetical protein